VKKAEWRGYQHDEKRDEHTDGLDPGRGEVLAPGDEVHPYEYQRRNDYADILFSRQKLTTFRGDNNTQSIILHLLQRQTTKKRHKNYKYHLCKPNLI